MGQVILFPMKAAPVLPAAARPAPVGVMDIKVLVSLNQQGCTETRYIIQAREKIDSFMVKEVEAVGVGEVKEKLEEILEAARARWLTPQLLYYPNDRPELRCIDTIFPVASA